MRPFLILQYRCVPQREEKHIEHCKIFRYISHTKIISKFSIIVGTFRIVRHYFLYIKLVQLYNSFMDKKIVSKTDARNNFSAIYEEAKSGKTMFVSDRGNVYVAVVAIEKLKTKIGPSFKAEKSKAFGMWKDKSDLKDKSSVEWLSEKRLNRVKELHGTLPSRYKHNS